MRPRLLVTAAAALAMTAAAEAATFQPYEMSGAFEDGGRFQGRFTPQGKSWISIFDFAGILRRADYFASGRDPLSNMFERIAPKAGGGSHITFVFDSYNVSTALDFYVVTIFDYLAPSGRPWSGDPFAIGAFLSGSFNYSDGTAAGYTSPATQARIAPVPLPASLPLIAGGLLALGLLARRKPA